MSFKDVLRKRARKNNSSKVLEKISPYDVLDTPVMTEKAYDMSNNSSKYTFKVHREANKIDVKKAIEDIYWVKPLKVNIVSVPKKWRAMRSTVRKPYKKAVVTLKEWDRISIVG